MEPSHLSTAVVPNPSLEARPNQGRHTTVEIKQLAPAVDKPPAHRTSLWTAPAGSVACPPLPVRVRHVGASTVTLRHALPSAGAVAAAMKFARMRGAFGGFAASWLFKLTAQAALSAGVAHGLVCDA